MSYKCNKEQNIKTNKCIALGNYEVKLALFAPGMIIYFENQGQSRK